TVAVVVVIFGLAAGWWWAELDTQRARLALEKANIAKAKAKIENVASEQKPPAPHKNICFLRSIAPRDNAGVLFYQDETPNCSRPPQVEPSWHRALVSHLHQDNDDPSKIQSQEPVLLSFTVDRSGHVLNREISREIARNRRNSDFENEAMSI